MANQETLYHVADRIATITLNRPDKLNAWTATMEQEVRTAIYEAEKDDNVRVIVLTGAGRGFCAGADMSLLDSIAQQGLLRGRPPWHGLLSRAGRAGRTRGASRDPRRPGRTRWGPRPS